MTGTPRLAVVDVTSTDEALGRLQNGWQDRSSYALRNTGLSRILVRGADAIVEAPSADPDTARVTRILVSTPQPEQLAAALGEAAGVAPAIGPIGGTDTVIHRVRVRTVTVEVMGGSPGVPAVDLAVDDLAAVRDRLVAAWCAGDPFVINFVGGMRLLLRAVA
ncbi:hypothetical protein [Tsukamurella soli]